ncbi:GNAT family N-acetyltransferase [Myceligenerans crystallogenes]|uniref:GNAT family N-acetyltransferase n=1 Tax=Myceligenerans crystallogenes TaxID=316335 RepID=A0ABN2NJM3_9MICO
MSLAEPVETALPTTTVAERAAAPATLPPVTAGALTWRGARRDDAGALHALQDQVSAADGEPFRVSLDEVEETLAAGYRDLDADFLLGFDDDGVLRAFAQADVRPGDRTAARAFVWGGVHPGRRGEGIGRELMAWGIARARQKLATSHLAGERVPAWIAVHSEDDAPASRVRLYEHAGFAVRRYYSCLGRDLAQPIPEPVIPGQEAGAASSAHAGAAAPSSSGSSLRLVAWTPELDEPARLARNDAFRDHWGSQPQSQVTWAEDRDQFMAPWTWLVVDDAPDVDALLASPDTDEETAAALRAGQPLVVAYNWAARYEQDFAVRGFTFGYSENVGARRAYRGRGLARAALAAGLRAMAGDGMQYALLDVDTANPTGALGLYAGLGYEKLDGSRMWSIEV